MNKLRIIIAIFTLLYLNSVAIGQWQIQNSGIDVKLWDVCFVDTLHGWAVGDSGAIISTNDGGRIWNIQNSPVDTVILEKVSFVNKNVGYIVGRSGTILSTKDGGATWLQNESGVDYSLWDLSFVNEDTGWIVGNDVLQTRRWGLILHTKNGGQTWEKQFETYSQNYFYSKLFRTVSFIDEKNGWAFAGDYVDNFSLTYVYRTNNGGEEWNIVSVVGMPVFEMSMVSQDTIWVSGFGFGRSFNGGLDWEYSDLLGGNVGAIAQIDGRTGWVYFGHLQENGIFFTDDAGATWTKIFVPGNPWFSALANIGRNYLWAVGDTGLVMRYTEHTNSVFQDENPLPQEFELAQNYPNPFNSKTNIRFSLKTHKYASLTLYDINGRKIRVLLSQVLAPGTYSVSWDGKDSASRQVSSGIYFYELQVGELAVKKKALLVR